ncbi:hypothetical protein BDW22DRAFT_536266 [Trametopsis cervina]|nr:hypothetical protein BDW22DRAFT_536266 [Trametopsis cervina]
MDPLFVRQDYKTFMGLLPADTKCLSDVDKSEAGDFQGLFRKECQRETEMYPILCETLEKTLELSNSDLTFKDCAEWREGQVHDGKPDIVAYPKDIIAAKNAYKHKGNTTVKDSRKQYRARMAYAWVELVIEAKYKNTDAAFGFGSDKHFLRDSLVGKEARAQLIRYATEIMHRQHRMHLYMVCITRSHARLLRWDRAGVLVSESIDLAAHPEQLLDFIHRFAQMTPEQRGRDPTAILVEEGSDEFRRVKQFKGATRWARKCLKESFDDTVNFPIYKILCQPVASPGAPSQSLPKPCAFFVGKAMTRAASPVGRATKGFTSYDECKNELVFFKDFWRPNLPKIRQELDTYALLNERQVHNIATVVAGGDVFYNNASQHTLTQTYIQSTTGPLERVHGRLVLAELACPLEDYFGSYELISVVNDAIQAHKEAWEAGVLHRDISVANIMISDTGEPGKRKGLLMDWDLCKYKEDMKLEATQPGGRSGTWAYMSWLSLQYPRKPVAVSDDLESFLYVLEHCALRFHSHSRSPPIPPTSTDLAAIHAVNSKGVPLSGALVSFFYEEYENTDGSFTGGLTKQEHIQSATPLAILRLSNSPLAVVLKKLYDLARDHYDTIDFQELEKYGPPKLDIQPAPPPGLLEESTAPLRAPDPKMLLLATHDAVLDVFKDVLQKYERFAPYNDKTFDQFYGLPCFEIKDTNASSKRPSVDSLHVEERKQKKRKVDSRSLHSIGEHGEDHA